MEPIYKISIFRDTFSPLMDKHGFKWQEGNEVDCNGKNYAWGQFVNGDRVIRAAFGPDISFIRYHIKKFDLTHDHFMSLLGAESPLFTGFKDEDLEEGIRKALSDIKSWGNSFLNGSVVSLLSTLSQNST